MIKSPAQLSIGAVERDTGIARDTLRVWERRYGYPVPERNDKGERIYSEQQLRHLQRVRRLMAQGYRPGKLLTMSDADLLDIEALIERHSAGLQDADTRRILDAVRSVDALQTWGILDDLYNEYGMRGFVLNTVVPLLKTVGELWAAGELQIYQEHFLTQQLERFFGVQIARLQQQAGKPLVLLATLPGEEHTLGLTMVSAMLSHHGVSILNLGGEVPMEQIVRAADQFNADVVGVTFSSAYHYASIRGEVEELRTSLPESVDVWIGGEGVRRMRKLPDGVCRFTTLETLPV